ncbi:MAG TPA: DUF2891 domain-containing protein [Candidatus Angelobacter sp.]|jgi:hypothetical protein|nr:DUF2891 domain-containing protein [Candidatus Angelobacter sp.]
MKKRVLLFITAMLAALVCQGQPQNQKLSRKAAAPPHAENFNVDAAQRFARLALACVHKEYPNKLAHSLNGDADVAPPRKLTPAFYGCYDWHSSIHGHWLLARLARSFPNAAFAPEARAAVQQSLTQANIAQEVVYLKADGRASFERPYGLAWLLQLGAELREWEKAEPASLAPELARNLQPLEQAAIERLRVWLPKLSHPVRSGEHSQTAFALGLIIDYARTTGDRDFWNLLVAKARDFYATDKNCPLAYEPSGEDFLSPCLAEADAMRRVLAPREFAAWLHQFLPQISSNGSGSWLRPEKSTDPSDPKLAHIDGLNLSRAWMLDGIASGLPTADRRLAALEASAAAHRSAGLAAVTGEHYEGGHWLGSFAAYLDTRRGISRQPAPRK